MATSTSTSAPLKKASTAPAPEPPIGRQFCANMTEIQVDGPLPFPLATLASGDVINSLCNTK